MKNEINFLDDLYTSYWESSNHEELVENSKSMARHYDTILLMINLFNNKYYHGFIFSNLVFNTDLWSKFSISDFENILGTVKRPANTRFPIEDHGAYCDIIFIYKYLNVDSLDIVYHLNIEDNIKKTIFNTMLSLVTEMILTNVDIENFKDGTLPNSNLYKHKHDLFIKNGFKKSKTDHEEIKKDIYDLIQNLTGVEE